MNVKPKIYKKYTLYILFMHANKYEPIPVYNELKTAFDQNLNYFNKDLNELVVFTTGVIYTYCAGAMEVFIYKIKNWEGAIGLRG